MSTRAIIGIIVLFLVIAGGIFFITRGGTQKSEEVFTPSGIELNKPTTSQPSETAIDTSATSQKACVQSGCNSELCVEEGVEVSSTCQAPTIEQSCLVQYAFCERQKTGQCGWSTTDKYNQCMIEVTQK